MDNYLLKAKNISKYFEQGSDKLEILKSIDFSISDGESVCIVGPSGSGKSTLLQILGTLDSAQSGEIFFENTNLADLDDDQLSKLRNEKIGFVFQFHHLILELTALENVMLPLQLAGMVRSECLKRAEETLYKMGVDHRKSHYPNELSGGELQRVSIARALVRKPKILFADEPTGNLDSHNSLVLQNLFFNIQKDFGTALVVVTHDMQFASKFPRVLKMRDGQWMS